MSAEVKTAEVKPDMVTIEVDGQPIEIHKGAMIIEATDKVGIDIPRFCYHKKLSIAANCRMCLVDVEKAPKPLPACATPVMDGMKVFTESRRSRDAQQGVMEFLLINHPLDCPICDQGGECELQDIAMGYGRSVSRFTERKRVVKDENLGALVSTDMTRCIHCTRCVRFLDEVAGTNELGGIGRGENTKISTYIGRSIDSEVSGNIIDLCPVGALTNKPYRFSARAWELRARAAVSTHDCLNSSSWYHVRRGTVMRAVPRDNEAVNETWLADRDRYAHFGLEHENRTTQPLIKQQSDWKVSDWQTAIEQAGQALSGAAAGDIGILVSGNSSCEDHFALNEFAKAGRVAIDYRLRVSDPAVDGVASSSVPVASLSDADAVLVIGSHLRHEQPLIASRLRQAWRNKGAKINSINAVQYAWNFKPEAQLTVAPAEWLSSIAAVCRSAFEQAKQELPSGDLGAYLETTAVDKSHQTIAAQLLAAENACVIAGQQVMHHPLASQLITVIRELTGSVNGQLLVLSDAANGRGARQVAAAFANSPLTLSDCQNKRVLILHDFDPASDVSDPALLNKACAQADTVIVLTSFATESIKAVADIILPVTAFAEVGGTLVNLDGISQRVPAMARPKGEARPVWKVVRVLSESAGFDTSSAMQWPDTNALQAGMDQAVGAVSAYELPHYEWSAPTAATTENGLQRLAEVPMYAVDMLCRHSAPLQSTTHAVHQDNVELHSETAAAEQLTDGQQVGLSDSSNGTSVEAVVSINDKVAPGVLRLPMTSTVSAALGAGFERIMLSTNAQTEGDA